MELIENSLDAGAKSDFALHGAGAERARSWIEDDGCGIAFAELPLAVERYATSKISSLEDLENYSDPLGYRGEALASVAAGLAHGDTQPRRGR